MNITLRAGERLFINGAVIRIDRKASIELLNEVTFLLENHVMQAEEATTLIRQIYFAVQIMLMDPSAAASAAPLARSLIESALGAYRAPELIAGLKSVAASLAARPQFRGDESAARRCSPSRTRSFSRSPPRRAPPERGERHDRKRHLPRRVPRDRLRPLRRPTAATQTLNYNDFLTLLMAEMKNQDPTQPMDPSQMVSQLATVSEVGQAVQTNTTLASLLTATSLTQAEQLIGRTVTSADGSTSGEVASVSVRQLGRGRHADQWRNRFARQRRERPMNEGDAIDLVQSAIWMVVVGAGPASARRWRSAS